MHLPLLPRAGYAHSELCSNLNWVAVEVLHPIHHILLLRHGQLRIYRKCQGLPGSPIRLGKLPLHMPQILEAFLEMEWERILDFGPDPLSAEERLERIPLDDPDDELIVIMSRKILR